MATAATGAGEGPKHRIMHFGTEEVVEAVSSLYDDELKPFGRILVKRLREQNAARATAALRLAGRVAAAAVVEVDSTPLIDAKLLRRFCESSKVFIIRLEEGNEYSVNLAGRPASFVDVASAEDCYPQDMWERFAAYLQGLEGMEIYMPGGRYACAKALSCRRLPFFSELTLGKLCHIVQLSVTSKKLLGYRDGTMVPFERSEVWLKERCAEHQQPMALPRVAAPSLPLATWEETRACLWEILNNDYPGAICFHPRVVSISNVKRLFRAQFNLELSETVLGYPRLLDLLQDERLSDICRIADMHKSKVVVQLTAPPGIAGSTRGSVESLCGDVDASCLFVWQDLPIVSYEAASDIPSSGWPDFAFGGDPGDTDSPGSPAPSDHVCLSTLPCPGVSGAGQFGGGGAAWAPRQL